MRNKICAHLFLGITYLFGATNCYTPPTLEEIDAGSNFYKQEADSGLILKEVKRDCREWTVGKENHLVCEYDTNNDGKNDSIVWYTQSKVGIEIKKARDSNGDGKYDQIFENQIFISPGEVMITPDAGVIEDILKEKRGTYL